MKLLIAKALIATSCIAGTTPCNDMCSVTTVRGHWSVPISGQAWVKGHWVKTKIRTWIPTKRVQKCEG